MPFIPYPGEVCDFCKTSYPTRVRFVTSVQHHTLPDKFCDFCTTFIPSPDRSVTSVTTSYRYQGMGYAFHTRTRGRSVTSVLRYTLPCKFCDFCTTFMPLPDSSVTSVTKLTPYRKYPHPTEHNLAKFSICSWRGVCIQLKR